jgi:hypothetical protein
VRFILTIGVALPSDTTLSRQIIDEGASLADIVTDVLVEGFTAATDVSVIECEVVDDDE